MKSWTYFPLWMNVDDGISQLANNVTTKTITNRRRGFTLLELVLVLAIIVAVGAIAAPMYQGTLRAERLRKAAEMVAADWTETRVSAMETGETQVWVCQIAENSYGSGAYSNNAGLSATDAVTAATGLQSTDTSTSTSQSMPDGVTISEVMVSEGDTVAMMALSSNESTGGSGIVYFYPDGSSSSARLSMTNDKEESMSVMLNGVAGTVRVVRGESSE